MKKILFSIFLILIVFFLFACSKAPIYQNWAEICFDIKSGKLFVTAEILIDNMNELMLTVQATIKEITFDDQNIEIGHSGDRLIFPSIHKKSKIHIEYVLPLEQFGKDKAYIFTRASKWFPFKYDVVSGLNFKISIPNQYKVYSCGNIGIIDSSDTSDTYRIINTTNISFAFIVAPANYYSHIPKVVKGKKIDFYFINKDPSIQNFIMSESCETFEYCTAMLGEYPRDNLIVIEFPGLHYCQSLEGLLIAGSWYVDNVQNQKMRFWPSHEMIHQWIGSGMHITIKDDNELRWFMEESLTEYLRMCMIEDTCGSDSLLAVLRSSVEEYHNNIKGTEKDVSIYENIPNRIIYLIGPLYFDYIRRLLGEDTWRKFIRELYSVNIDKIITYKDFRNTLSKYLSIEAISKIENLLKSRGIPDKILRS